MTPQQRGLSQIGRNLRAVWEKEFVRLIPETRGDAVRLRKFAVQHGSQMKLIRPASEHLRVSRAGYTNHCLSQQTRCMTIEPQRLKQCKISCRNELPSR